MAVLIICHTPLVIKVKDPKVKIDHFSHSFSGILKISFFQV